MAIHSGEGRMHVEIQEMECLESRSSVGSASTAGPVPVLLRTPTRALSFGLAVLSKIGTFSNVGKESMEARLEGKLRCATH
jgi:hypothetical protein